MKLFNFSNKSKKTVDLNTGLNEVSKSTTAPIRMNKQKMKDFVVKAVGEVLHHSNERSNFLRPEYNLWEIKEAAEADSYIKISLSKYSQLIYKAGAALKGEDERVEYIKKRFRMMSFATQKPMDILFQEVADDLIKYSNAFLIKKRVQNIPGMNLHPIFDTNKVVGGYFRVDPASVDIKRDENGNIVKYQQGYNEKVEFYPYDVIHFYLDKDANNAYGTPRIIAALEDVKLLRKIEGNVSALIYRFSMPVYQWIVGLPQTGMSGTDPEIEKAKREVENSTFDGIVVTNERTNIKAIGAEGNALNAEGYLKYFEARVFSALGVSASQMGRGGAKQDADSMESQVHDTVKYIQRIMSIFIEEFMLNELLLEGGYNPILNEEDIVNYEFEEISLETKVKKENHEMLKYQSNVKTFDETRRSMGMKDTPENEDRLYKNFIDTNARMKELDRTVDNQIKLAKENSKLAAQQNNNEEKKNVEAGSTANKKPRSSKGDSSTKAVDNNNRPANQYGKTSVKIKENFIEEQNEKEFKEIYKIYNKARNDIKSGESFDLILPLIADSLKTMLNNTVEVASTEALMDAIKEAEEIKGTQLLYPAKKIVLTDFYEEIDNGVKKILKEIQSELKQDKEVDEVFDNHKYKLRFLEDFVTRKVYWYSYIKTGALCGIKKAYIDFNSEDDAKGKKKTLNTNAFAIEDIPAYHSFCNCIVKFKK